MVPWIKGLALGFGAGVLTMGVVSFVSYLAPSEQPSAAVRAAPATNGETAEQPGTPTIARVQGLVPAESAPARS